MTHRQHFGDHFTVLHGNDNHPRAFNRIDLPQEVIDEIIDHIPRTDDESLRSCSLVAKSWGYAGRRRLFEYVDLVGDGHLRWWRSNISPTNIELLQHIRSLSYEIPEARSNYHMRDYSPSLRQLRDLSLYGGCLSSFNQIGTPTAFQHTLSYIYLRCCSVTTSALVTFVNYFPNLAHLDLSGVSHKVDSQLIPPLSRPLRKLSIREFGRSGLGLIEQVMDLHPQCDDVTVSLSLYSTSCPSLVQCVIDGVGASVKRLSLEWQPADGEAPVTLSNCQELRELDLYVMHPVELGLISSITSTNMQRITLNHPRKPHERPVRDPPGWTQFDDLLLGWLTSAGLDWN